MKGGRLNIVLIGLVIGLVACDEVIELDIEQTPPRIVIEGQWTNVPASNFVKISQSVSFYDDRAPDRVAGAEVSILDEKGNVVVFQHNPFGSTDSIGFYLPPKGVRGVVGDRYFLQVDYGGVTYRSEDVMMAVGQIDSLQAVRSVPGLIGQSAPEDAYIVKVYAREPRETEDFYLMRFYKNNVVTRAYENDIYIADDTALGEAINGVPIPFFYNQSDTAKVEMYGITRQAYAYYLDLQFVINNDGGMFGPPPANPVTNIDNDALGFFLVAAVTEKSIVVQ